MPAWLEFKQLLLLLEDELGDDDEVGSEPASSAGLWEAMAAAAAFPAARANWSKVALSGNRAVAARSPVYSGLFRLPCPW